MIPLLFVDDCTQEITSFFYKEEGFLVFSHVQGWTMMLDQCAHLHIPLSTGWIEGQCVVCPWHQWKYDTKGKCVWPPAADESIQVFPILEEKKILWTQTDNTDNTDKTWVSHLLAFHWKDMEHVASKKDIHMIGLKNNTRIWCAGDGLEDAQAQLDELLTLYLPH